MRIRFYVSLVFFWILSGLTAQAAVLQSLDLPGLWKTDPDYIRQVMDSKEGHPFSITTFENDLDRIRSWELYRYVRGSVFPATDAVTAVVELGERWTITPVFRPISGGGVYSLKVGARDTNFLGKFYEVALYGGGRGNWDGKQPLSTIDIQPILGGWVYMPYFRGGPWESVSFFDMDFLEDPVYQYGSLQSVTSRRIFQGFSGLGYRFDDDNHIRGWLGYAKTKDELRTDYLEKGVISPVSLQPDLDTVSVGAEYIYGLPVYTEPYYTGGDSKVLLMSQISTKIRPAVYLRAQQRYFFRFWKRFNLASRFLTEWTTSSDWIRLRTLGGLTNLRGYPDRYFHARGYVVSNLELRGTVLHWDWSSLQLKAFVDAAVMTGVDDGSRIKALEATWTVGAGFYYWLPILHKMRFRLDIARPVDRRKIGGIPDISSGIVQFF